MSSVKIVCLALTTINVSAVMCPNDFCTCIHIHILDLRGSSLKIVLWRLMFKSSRKEIFERHFSFHQERSYMRNIPNKVSWKSHKHLLNSFHFHPDTMTPCPYRNLSREAPPDWRTHLPASSTTADACSGSRHYGIDGRVWPQDGNGLSTGRHPPLGHPSVTEHLKQS